MVVVMVVVRLGRQELRVHVELGVQVEAAQVEHLLERHLAEMHHLLRRARVHVLQAVLQRIQFPGIHQVGLADEDLVGKTHLALRFHPVVQLLRRMLGIHQRDDGVQQIGLGDLVVHEEGLRHRAGVGQARGLDHHPLEIELALALSRGQIAQGGAQVFTDGAADAAVAHLDDLLLLVGDQDLVVDVFFAEFVLDHGDLLAVRLGQHALEQRRLARAEEAGKDGGGNQGHGVAWRRGRQPAARAQRTETAQCSPAPAACPAGPCTAPPRQTSPVSVKSCTPDGRATVSSCD